MIEAGRSGEISPENLQPNVVEQRGNNVVVRRDIVHDKFGMQLVADDIVRGDGSEGKYFWVNFNNDAVLLFGLDDEDNLYMTNEFAYADDSYQTEVPGGSVGEGEDIDVAAKREAMEELGLTTESFLCYLGGVKEISFRVNHLTHLFMARVADVGEVSQEAGEDISLRKVPFERAVEMVETGEIESASVQAGIRAIAAYMQQESDLDI